MFATTTAKPTLFFAIKFTVSVLDSNEMIQLESEKRTARSVGEGRRKMFQQQDSVLNETFNASQAR